LKKVITIQHQTLKKKVENQDDNTPFEIQDLKYTGHSVISESIIDLQGTYAVNEKTRKLKLIIRAPGFKRQHLNKDHLKLWINRRENEFGLTITIEPPTNSSANVIEPKKNSSADCVDSDAHITDEFVFPEEVMLKMITGKYKCQLPETRRFLLPDKNHLYDNTIITVADGEITIILDLESDFQDSENS